MPNSSPVPDPIQIFDRLALRRNRARAAALGDSADFLFVESAERLADRLADINRRFPRVLDLGCRNGQLGRAMRGRAGIEWMVAADPSPGFARLTPAPRLAAESEALPFAPRSFDAVFSNLALHWTNDLPGALLQLRQMLRPDGLLLAALFGGDTLNELRQAWLEAESEMENGASPRVSLFADPRDLAGLLQRAGFALPVVDSDRIEVTYSDALKLMQDLRLMGEANTSTLRRRNLTRRTTLLKAAAIYQSRFARADGRLRATFEIVTLTAWAPHESQQKPLRPGSAESRLADALKTGERSADEKAGR